MKNQIQIASILLISVVFLMGCTRATGLRDVDVNTLKGNNVDFASYQTYFLLPEPPSADDPYSSVVKSFPRQFVEEAVLSELAARNYKEVEDKDLADMLVAIQFSLKDEERKITFTSSDYGNNGYHTNPYGYNYRSYYGYQTFSNTTTIVEEFRKGNMIVDLIDRKENALIWEGYAKGEGETDIDAMQSKIKMVVGEMFSRYPIVIEAK